MKVRILRSTRNVGEYVGEQTADDMEEAIRLIHSERRNPDMIYWQQEGQDLCAYACEEDAEDEDEDKAVARLRPLAIES